VTTAVSPETSFLELGESFSLERGGTLAGLRVAYRTWGSVRNGAILVCHALTGSADADEWWGGLFGSGRVLDPADTFIISTNVLGGTYGTTGPTDRPPGGGARYGPDFPEVTIRDMVRLQARVLDHLGVERLNLVIGGSMGGMQVLEWARLFPNRVKAIVPIGVTAHQTAWAIGLSDAQRAAITGDPHFRSGRYQPGLAPEAGLGTARMIATLSYRSPGEFESRFGRETNGDRFAAQTYLHHQARKLVDRFDANTYLTLLAAMDSHDVSGALEEIRTPALVVGVSSDGLYPLAEVSSLATQLPFGELAVLQASQGHDAFLIETGRLNRLVTGFVRRLASGWTPGSATAARGAAWA
jgi:homoserine O-acetyltransferase